MKNVIRHLDNVETVVLCDLVSSTRPAMLDRSRVRGPTGTCPGLSTRRADGGSFELMDDQGVGIG